MYENRPLYRYIDYFQIKMSFQINVSLRSYYKVKVHPVHLAFVVVQCLFEFVVLPFEASYFPEVGRVDLGVGELQFRLVRSHVYVVQTSLLTLQSQVPKMAFFLSI